MIIIWIIFVCCITFCLYTTKEYHKSFIEYPAETIFENFYMYLFAVLYFYTLVCGVLELLQTFYVSALLISFGLFKLLSNINLKKIIKKKIIEFLVDKDDVTK